MSVSNQKKLDGENNILNAFGVAIPSIIFFTANLILAFMFQESDSSRSINGLTLTGIGGILSNGAIIFMGSSLCWLGTKIIINTNKAEGPLDKLRLFEGINIVIMGLLGLGNAMLNSIIQHTSQPSIILENAAWATAILVNLYWLFRTGYDARQNRHRLKATQHNLSIIGQSPDRKSNKPILALYEFLIIQKSKQIKDNISSSAAFIVNIPFVLAFLGVLPMSLVTKPFFIIQIGALLLGMNATLSKNKFLPHEKWSTLLASLEEAIKTPKDRTLLSRLKMLQGFHLTTLELSHNEPALNKPNLINLLQI